MTYFIKPTLFALSAVVALGACTDPGSLGGNGDHAKAQQGALIGGLVGAGIGAATAGGNTGKSAATGALAGAALGGIIGNELDKQARELEQNLGNDISVVNTGDKLVVSLPNDLTFDTDSAAVRPELKGDLAEVAASMQRYPDTSVQVIGHTDSDGDAAYNQALSERRANAVADLLQAGGVSYDRVRTLGRGEDEPVASNLTEDGKSLNRRVEIVVIPNG
ncbi:MAG: OmpA family protein [Paracoccaceae bacterium]